MKEFIKMKHNGYSPYLNRESEAQSQLDPPMMNGKNVYQRKKAKSLSDDLASFWY